MGPGMIGPVDPSLIGTMSQGALVTLMERLRQENEQALQEHTRLATEQADQAKQQMQQAVQAPPEQPNPQAEFLQTLVGNTASVLGGNKTYAEHAQAGIQSERAGLMAKRKENLAHLQDVYKVKAEEAQKAGDLEATEKYRGRLESLHKQIDLVNDNLDRQNRLDIAREGNKTKENVADTKNAPPVAPAGWEKEIIHTPGGQQAIDISRFFGKQKAAITEAALAQGIPLTDAAGSAQLREIQSARRGVDTVLLKIQDLLPPDAQQRIAQTPGITMSQLLQTNARRASYPALWSQAIRQLRAMAGSKSFRMTEAEINRTIANDMPKLTDTYDVAMGKMQSVIDMLDNAEMPITSNDWRGTARTGPTSVIGGGGLTAAAPAGPAPAATHRYNPKTGTVEAITP